MLMETGLFRGALYSLKECAVSLLDRAPNNRVRSAIEARIETLDYIFRWLDMSEKQGKVDMTELKLGELTTWKPAARKGKIQIDEKIISDSKALKKNFDAVRVTVEHVKWTTLSNRVYELRRMGEIADNIVPRRDENGVPHLVYLDEPNPRRGKKVA